MAKINRKERWSSALDMLNVLMPAEVIHAELVRMTRVANLSLFKFRPENEESGNRNRPWSVKDIVEFRSRNVRFVVFENELGDSCCLIIEFLEDHGGHRTQRFEMAEI